MGFGCNQVFIDSQREAEAESNERAMEILSTSATARSYYEAVISTALPVVASEDDECDCPECGNGRL
jgi:hypothetical protein